MGSCQNLAYYLSVCSLSRYVGNLIIHCSSLSENMYSKCSIFTLFNFSCGVLGKKWGYILYAYVLIARTQMEKEPFTSFETFNVWGSTQENSNRWVVVCFQGISIFSYYEKSHTRNDFITLWKEYYSNHPLDVPYNIISFQFILKKKREDIYDSDFIVSVAQLVFSYASQKKNPLCLLRGSNTSNVKWLVAIYSQQYILPACKTFSFQFILTNH